MIKKSILLQSGIIVREGSIDNQTYISQCFMSKKITRSSRFPSRKIIRILVPEFIFGYNGNGKKCFLLPPMFKKKINLRCSGAMPHPLEKKSSLQLCVEPQSCAQVLTRETA